MGGVSKNSRCLLVNSESVCLGDDLVIFQDEETRLLVKGEYN